ncbi:MAG: site-specific DNA-methyltransferase [Oscillospiraceae bacterium]|nr:site-specific DNA-methyltransferase [Oscillospiraceae bacterium]
MSANESILNCDYMSFSEAHPGYPISELPDWIQENIETAKVYGRDNKCVILADGRKYHLDNKLNDITGRDWTLFINSVFTTRYPTSGEESYAHKIRRIHPSPKPPQLMRELIEFFTKKGELVFDCFSGVGGTLLGAAMCERKAAGIELNSAYIEAYKNAADALGLTQFPVFCGDALSTLEDKNLPTEQKISLMLIDPPYMNMMSKPKTGGDALALGSDMPTPFTDDIHDLGNMERETFLNSLKRAVELTLPFIKFRGYVVVFIKDMQPKKKQLNFLHSEVAEKINELPNVYYKGMKIWADNSAKMYPYGYPFCFVANQIHQYILIFRKEK